jgi:hypothetical protein
MRILGYDPQQKLVAVAGSKGVILFRHDLGDKPLYGDYIAWLSNDGQSITKVEPIQSVTSSVIPHEMYIVVLTGGATYRVPFDGSKLTPIMVTNHQFRLYNDVPQLCLGGALFNFEFREPNIDGDYSLAGLVEFITAFNAVHHNNTMRCIIKSASHISITVDDCTVFKTGSLEQLKSVSYAIIKARAAKVIEWMNGL